MWYSFLAVVLLVVLLSACEDGTPQRAQAFAQTCSESEFSEKQCLLLWQLSERSRRDSRDAQAMASFAIGFSAGRSR